MRKIFEVFWQEEGGLFVGSRARWGTRPKDSVDLERRFQDIKRQIQMLNKRQGIFQNAAEDKLRVQDRASERLRCRIIEEEKELEQ